MGYSDAAITHLMCVKAGLSSFYGPIVLAELAENVEIFSYTADWLKKVFFSPEIIGNIPVSAGWTGERIEWSIENANTVKKLNQNKDYEFLQGRTTVSGRLFGGCIEVLEMAKGTDLWPEPAFF